VENGDNLDDKGYSIVTAADGHYVILCAFEDKNYTGIFNIHLIKLDKDDLRFESIIWNRLLIENCYLINASVIELNDGYAVVGALTDNKLSLVRTSQDGVSLWERSYDNSDCSSGASVCRTQDGGFLILSSGMTLIKTDGNGLELERTDFRGEALGNRCVMQSTDGGYVFTGVFENTGSGLMEMKIIKMYPDLKNSVPDL
jgi:hypothetical protein